GGAQIFRHQRRRLGPQEPGAAFKGAAAALLARRDRLFLPPVRGRAGRVRSGKLPGTGGIREYQAGFTWGRTYGSPFFLGRAAQGRVSSKGDNASDKKKRGEHKGSPLGQVTLLSKWRVGVRSAGGPGRIAACQGVVKPALFLPPDSTR